MSSQYDIIQANVLRILEPAALGDRASRIWDLSLFALVVLNLIAVALESVPALQTSYGRWLYNFEIFSVIVLFILGGFMLLKVDVEEGERIAQSE